MANFRSVGGQKKYFKYAECEQGQVLVEGKFVGAVPSRFQGNNYEFRPEQGPIVSLNHSGHLKYLIETYVKEGDLCRVIYDGKTTIEKGAMAGKEAHQFKVEVADSPEQMEMDFNQENTGSVSLSDLD